MIVVILAASVVKKEQNIQQIVGVIVPEDYSVKLNECENVEKYRNHARVIVEHESVSCNQDLKK